MANAKLDPTGSTLAIASDRVEARRHAEELDEGGRLALARMFCFSVVRAWWLSLTAGHDSPTPLREPFQAIGGDRLNRPMRALSGRIGSSLGALEVERAAYHVGLTYIGMLSPAHRAAHGVYYTPPALGARLIHQASAAGVDWRTARVLDPACGGGAFLAPVARRIVEAMGPCEPRILVQNVAQRLRGFEIDPFAAWLAQVTLDALFLPITGPSRSRLPSVVTVRDTLAAEPSVELFDLVIGNPPYGRVRLGASDRRRFERCLFGHANLYGLFTDVAIRHAKPGGIIAYVTPTSFLAGEYSKKLRTLLATEAPPRTIDFLAGRDGVFPEVLQETVLATYRRAGKIERVRIHELSPLDEDTLLVQPAADAALPTDPSTPWILPRGQTQVRLAATLSDTPHRLADWGYTVSTGPLVWNRYKAQLEPRRGRDRYPVIWAESVSADGFMWRAEKRGHVPYFQVLPGDEWMMIRKPCVLLQRTTAKEQYRRLIAASLPRSFVNEYGAVVVENHLNMVRPLDGAPAISSEVLAAFLNSGAADHAFRCVSGSVAVSAYELEALPLPDPANLGQLTRLVRSRATREAVEAECERLYCGDR